MRRQRRSFLLFPVFTYLCFFAGNIYTARYLVLRVVAHLLPLVLLGMWLIGLIRQRTGFLRSELDRPILTWLGVAVAASFAGLSPRFSLECVCLQLTYALSFYAFLEFTSHGRGATVLRALFMTGAVVCIVGLAEWVSWYLGLSYLPGATVAWPAVWAGETLVPPVFHRLNATLGGSTSLAAFLALLIPPAAAWMLTSELQQPRWALGFWLAAAVIVEVLTFSRGGILALGVSLSLTGLGWTAVRPDWLQAFGQRLQTGDRWRFWAGCLALLLILALVGAFWISNSFAGRHGSTTHRLVLWEAALETFRQHPVFGVGPANFGRSLLLRNDHKLPRRQIQTAHNAYLNTAAELGLVGLLAGAWLLWTILRGWVVGWRHAPSDRRLRELACGAALVGLAVHSLVDTFTTPANWLPVLVLAAFILAPPLAEDRSRWQRGQPWWPGIALLALSLSTAWLGWQDIAQYHFERSTSFIHQGDFEQASREAHRAEAMDPRFPPYTFQRAYIQALRGDSQGDPSLVEQAIVSYRAGLALERVWGSQTANLASLLWQHGRIEEALEWMERTVSADQRADYLLNLGLLYERNGEHEKAWNAYSMALANNPGSAGSGFWHAEPIRSEAWPTIEQKAEIIVRQRGDARVLARFRLQVAMVREDYSQVELLARSIVATRPDSPEGYIWLARSRLDQQNAADALVAAERAVQAAPRNSDALTVRGCARWQTEEDLGAMDDLKMALFISPGALAPHACLGQIYEEQGGLDAAIESYSRALKGRMIAQDVELTLYGRLATIHALPGLIRVRMGEPTAAPWLKVARLYEQMDRCEDARAAYRALLAEDAFLEAARKRMESLPCQVGGEVKRPRRKPCTLS